MKKQISYPKFIPRIFAMTIDIVIFTILVSPIIQIISNYIFIYIFQDFLAQHNIDVSDQNIMMLSAQVPEFGNYFTLSKTLSYSGSLLIVNITFMGIYFVTLWHKFGTSPGKYIMLMRIVDADSYLQPSLYNLIKRFLGYSSALFGIWSIPFNKRGLSLHDKIANTVVIKR